MCMKFTITFIGLVDLFYWKLPVYEYIKLLTMKLKSLHQAVLTSLLVASTAHADMDINNAVTMSGVVEVSISQFEHDAVVAAIDTLELTFGAQLADNIDAELVLLDEALGTSDHTGVAVDRAVVNFTTDMGVITAGKMTVPFASDNTNMISDSVTLEEPVGYGVVFANSFANLVYSVYATTPDNDYTQTGDNNFADLSGMNVGYRFNDYSNIDASVVSVDGKTSTAFAFAGNAGKVGVIAQMTNMYGEAQPRANVEISYSVGYGTFAIAAQRDAASKEIWLYGFSADVTKDLTANVEYKENVSDQETTFTMQLAYNF